eukprot:gene5875-4195_t
MTDASASAHYASRTQWISFFAELTGRLTHHDVLVVLDGCESLKRLLLTQISVAALLEEGDTLRHLLRVLSGGLRPNESSVSPSLPLNQELVLAQLDTVETILHLMISLHGEGNPYYCLLVRYSAGPIVQCFTELLRRCHPHVFGWTAYLLSHVLELPLGVVPCGIHTDSLHSPSSSVAYSSGRAGLGFRRHVEQLVRGVMGQETLLNQTHEALSALWSASEGSPRVAVQHVRTQVMRRQQAAQLFRRQWDQDERRGSSPRTPRPHWERYSGLAADYELTEHLNTTLRADTSVTLNSTSKMEVHDQAEITIDLTMATAGEGGEGEDSIGTAPQAQSPPREGRGEGEAVPPDGPCDIPVSVCEKALVDMSKSSSHDEFFVRFNILWCLTTAATPSMLQALTPATLREGLQRFMESAPNTRQDRSVFRMVLHWLAGLLSLNAVHRDTRDALAHLAGVCLLPCLRRDRAKQREREEKAAAQLRGGGGSAVPRFSTAAAAADAEARHYLRTHVFEASSTPSPSSSSPEGAGGGRDYLRGGQQAPSLLPYSIAQLQERRILAAVPPVSTSVLSFLLVVVQSCTPDQVNVWVHDGAALAVLAEIIQSVEDVRGVQVTAASAGSGLLFTEAGATNSVGDEVYLRGALNSVRTDATTVGMMACKLLAGLLWSHAHALRGAALLPACSVALQSVIPALLRIAVQNPTLLLPPHAAGVAGEGDAEAAGVAGHCHPAGSPLYHASADYKVARYTSLGEVALIAADTCLWFAHAAHLSCVDLSEVLAALPAVSRCSRTSIHPALRSFYYRTLAHLCRTPAHLSEIAQHAPSAINAAMASVLQHSANAPQWEAAAAAEWLRTVVNVCSQSIQFEVTVNFFRTALPLKLLDLVANATHVNYTSSVLLGLLLELHGHQQRLAQYHLQHAADRRDGEDALVLEVSVLVPYGRRSLTCWLGLLQLATAANTKVISTHEEWREAGEGRGEEHNKRIMIPHCPTKDALSRAMGAAESMAAQCAYSCALLRGLHGLLEHHPELAPALPSGLLLRFLCSVFQLPAPAEFLVFCAQLFAGDLEEHPALTQAYHDLIQWACELGGLWFERYAALTCRRRSSSPEAEHSKKDPQGEGEQTATDIQQGSEGGGGAPKTAATILPPSFLPNVARVMGHTSLAQRTRCHFPRLLVPMIRCCARPSGAAADSSGPFAPQLRGELEAHSRDLFAATTTLKGNFSGVQGLQCRLLRAFGPACAAAVELGWATRAAQQLEADVAELPRRRSTAENRAAAAAAAEERMQSYLVQLSLLTNMTANPSCPGLPGPTVQRFAASLCEGLRLDATRTPTMRAVTAMASSSEGRRVLLWEICSGGDAISRTAFGRVLAVALDLRVNWGGGGASRGRGTARSQEQQVAQLAHTLMGYQIGTVACTAVTAEDPLAATFVGMMVKFKGLDVLCDRLEAWDRKKPSPITAAQDETADLGMLHPALQWLAVMSATAEVQRIIYQHSLTVSILVEMAGGVRRWREAATGPSHLSSPFPSGEKRVEATAHTISTLALIVLRHMCYLPRLKTSICQDARVMFTFKAALLAMESVAPLVLRCDAGDGAGAEGGLSFSAAMEEELRRLQPNSTDKRQGLGTTSGGEAEERAVATSAAAVTLVDWAHRVAEQKQSQRKRLIADTLRLPAPPSATSPPLAPIAAAEALAKDKEVLRWVAATASTLQRQEIAATALWALCAEHHKGRMYVRRLLRQAPAVSLSELQEGARLIWREQGLDGRPREDTTALRLSHSVAELEFLLSTENSSPDKLEECDNNNKKKQTVGERRPIKPHYRSTAEVPSHPPTHTYKKDSFVLFQNSIFTTLPCILSLSRAQHSFFLASCLLPRPFSLLNPHKGAPILLIHHSKGKSPFTFFFSRD